MTVTAPETELRQRLITVATAEFKSESIVFKSDKIHDSLGHDGVAVGGVYPGPAEEENGQGLVQRTTVFIQIYTAWDKKVDPHQEVDPALIEGYAERLRRAVEDDNNGAPGDQHLWYYRITRIEYPPDPTGNITRLIATVTASSQNAGLVETTG
jgi:hypothetical protein